MEQSDYWPALLARISSREDALRVVREAAILIALLAFALAIIDAATAPVWSTTRLIFPLILVGLALGLWISWNRTVAMIIVLIFLSAMAVVYAEFILAPSSPPLRRPAMAWSLALEGLIAILGLAAGVRATMATTTLGRQVTRTGPVEPTSSGSLPSSQSQSLLQSLIHRSPTARWLTIVLPPLLFIPLIFAPPDLNPFILLWVAAVIAFLTSGGHLIRYVYRQVNRQGTRDHVWVRPALTILIIVAAVMLVAKSRQSADEYGTFLANLAQSQCKALGSCPTTLEEFTCEEVPFRKDGTCQFTTTYGEYGAQFRISYTLPKDRRTFHLVVRHDMDSRLVFTGGVATELRESRDR